MDGTPEDGGVDGLSKSRSWNMGEKFGISGSDKKSSFGNSKSDGSGNSFVDCVGASGVETDF